MLHNLEDISFLNYSGTSRDSEYVWRLLRVKVLTRMRKAVVEILKSYSWMKVQDVVTPRDFLRSQFMFTFTLP